MVSSHNLCSYNPKTSFSKPSLSRSNANNSSKKASIINIYFYLMKPRQMIVGVGLVPTYIYPDRVIQFSGRTELRFPTAPSFFYIFPSIKMLGYSHIQKRRFLCLQT